MTAPRICCLVTLDVHHEAEVKDAVGRRRTTTRAVLAALLLLGAAACGDDEDGAGGTGPGGIGSGTQDGAGAEAGGDAAGTGAEIDFGVDACTLLQATEIEAQFAEVGPVGEGVPSDLGSFFCRWEAEENGATQADMLPPEVWVKVEPLYEGTSVAGALGDPIPVEGLGDEAYYDANTAEASLHVGAGEWVVALGAVPRAVHIDTGTGMQNRLAALAELILGRL